MKLTILGFLLVLTGCVTLEPATTTRDRITYAEGQYHGFVDALSSSLNAGEVSSIAAGNIAAQADDVNKVLILAAEADAAGDLSTANGKLTAALVALQALQDELRAEKGRKK